MSINLTGAAQLFRISRLSNKGFCSIGNDNNAGILFNFTETVISSFDFAGWNILDAQFLNNLDRLGLLLEKYEEDIGGDLILTLRMVIIDMTGNILQDTNVLTRTIPYSTELKITLHLFSVDAIDNNFLFLFRIYTGDIEEIKWNYVTDTVSVRNTGFTLNEFVTEQQDFKLVGTNNLFFITKKNSQYIFRYDLSSGNIENWLTLPGEGGFITNDGGYSFEGEGVKFTTGENLISTSGDDVIIIDPIVKIITKTIPIGIANLVGLEYFIGEKGYIVILKTNSLQIYDVTKTSNWLVATKTFALTLEQFIFDRVAGLSIIVGNESGDTKLSIYKVFSDSITYIGGYYITDLIKDVLVDFPSEQVIYTTENSNEIIFRTLMNGYILQLTANEKTFEWENIEKTIIITGKVTDASDEPIQGVTLNWEIVPDATVSATLVTPSSITNANGYASTTVNIEGVGKCRINANIVS
jgi:hypothetical protein